MINLDVNDTSLHFARAIGSGLIGLGAMAWFARNSGPSQARNALTLSLTLVFLLEGIEYIRGIASGYLQPIAWAFAGMWLILFVLMVLAGRSAMTEAS